MPLLRSWSARSAETREVLVRFQGVARQWVASITVMHWSLKPVIRVRFPGDPPDCQYAPCPPSTREGRRRWPGPRAGGPSRCGLTDKARRLGRWDWRFDSSHLDERQRASESPAGDRAHDRRGNDETRSGSPARRLKGDSGFLCRRGSVVEHRVANAEIRGSSPLACSRSPS